MNGAIAWTVAVSKKTYPIPLVETPCQCKPERRRTLIRVDNETDQFGVQLGHEVDKTGVDALVQDDAQFDAAELRSDDP